MIKVKIAEKKDYLKIRKFLKKKLRKNHILQNKKYFFWFYLSDIKTKKFLIAIFKNKVIGCLGLHLNIYNVDAKKKQIGWIMNWLSTNERQCFGVGLILLKRAMEISKNLISIDASNSNLKIVKKIGWRSLPALNRFILKPQNVNKKRINKIKNKNFKLPNFNFVISQKFLKWRIIEHPCFKYYVFAKNKIVILIYRLQKIKNFGVEKDKVILKIIYYNLCYFNDAIKKIHEIAYSLSMKKKLFFCEAFSNQKQIDKAFEINHWTKESKLKLNFPTKFWPLKWKKNNYNFECYFQDKKMFKNVFTWHLIECDADRPPCALYNEK